MANLNKVLLIGRLTRDPEMVTFANGGRLAKFGFAVNNRKKNQSTGEWENDPVFLDVEASNRETGQKLADLVEQYLKKGHQVYLECHMKLDTWNDKTSGEKRSKLKFVVNDMQFLEPKSEGANSEGGAPRLARGGAAAPVRRPETGPTRNGGGSDGYEDEPEAMEPPPGRGGQEDDIPF
jgi:single-strand DNA-binding protein